MSYGLPSLEHIEGVTIKRYRPLFTIFGYWVTPMILKDLLTDPFDIINAHCVRSFQFDIAALVSWIKNRKLIATPHGSLYSYGAIPHGLRRLLFSAHNAILKFVFRRAHTVVATSPEEENQFTRFGLDIGKIVPLQNFLDETQFVNLPSPGEFRKQQGIGLDENVILFLGRLDRIKGLDLLLRAFSKIAKRMDGVWLVIVGPDGGYQRTIKQMINGTEFSSHVLLAGPRYGRSKLQALVDSTIVVVPSYYESFGITALEASFSGKAVVASKVGGLPDLVVHGETGLLFEKGNVDQLVDSLEWALTNPKTLKLMGHKGRQRAFSLYSSSAVEKSVALLYSQSY